MYHVLSLIRYTNLGLDLSSKETEIKQEHIILYLQGIASDDEIYMFSVSVYMFET